MITRVIMPKAGQTVEEGTVVAWLKQVGERVEKGEVLLEVETDKATLEVEAPASGVLLAVLCEEGETVPVLTPIGLIGEEGDDVAAALRELEAESSAPAAAPPTEPAPPAPAAAPPPEASRRQAPARGEARGRPLASPRARRLARELGVDLASVRGSGPGGRITEEDVRAAASSAAGEAARLSPARSALAKAVTYSKQHIPHFYVKLTVQADRLVALREELKARLEVTLNDLFVAAVARAMMEFPEFRSRLEGDTVVRFDSANVGIAVATEEGLLVPAVPAAERLSLEELAGTLREVTRAARAGKVHSSVPATLTVSNLGAAGAEEFQAIINPPECAILAVGAVRDDVVVRDGRPTVAKVVTLTLSADHRLIDGLIAARFLARLKDLLESPEGLLQ